MSGQGPPRPPGDQLPLALDPPDEPLNDLDRKTREWLDANPTVLPMFERFALQVAARGRRFGMRLLSERVRWERVMTWAKDDAGYKINDHATPYIARILIRRNPHLADLIETRHVEGEDHQEQEAS